MVLAARMRAAGLLGILTLAVGVSSAVAQVATGEIYGRVTDATGAVLPGAAVTITSPALLQPLRVTSTDTGAYRFPRLPIGIYSIRFELAGFGPLVREGIRIEIGLNAQVDATLAVGGVDQAVHVSGGSPLIDLKDAGKHSRFTRDMLEAIPSARDPWAIIEQSAGVAMDRQNVGGSSSGMQGNVVVRGTVRESKWSLDGVDITDMAATGSSPVYYDFDAFEEVQVTTGGADVTTQSSGLTVNLVTKSGTDTFRGSGRYYVTDRRFEANNVTDELREQGVYTGNPIQNIKDYGVEVGGPLVKGRAWAWGGYGTQRVNVGINNFYKSDARCRAMQAAPLSASLEDIQSCLETDKTTLETYNLKLAFQVARSDQFSFLLNASEKNRPTREASDLRPIQTTLRQGPVTREDLGSRWWTTGIPKTYKWSDRHILSDRFVLEAQYAHVGNNFIATFHDESLRQVQPLVDQVTGRYERSHSEDINVRPADIVTLTGTCLLPGLLHGDHALTFGFTYRNDLAHKETEVGGNAVAVLSNGVPAAAQLYRNGAGEYRLHNRSVYVQDSYTHRRFTINAGLRFDHQSDYVNAATIPASPFFGQRTFAGVYLGSAYAGDPFNQLPEVSFAGANPGVAFDTVSPRAGVSVDLTGSGRNVLKVSFGRYTGQLGLGNSPLAMVGSPVGLTYITYPWRDLNHDLVVEADEIVLSQYPIDWSTGYDPTSPTRPAGTVDTGLSADRSNEIIVSVERAFTPAFAATVSYIWRRYTHARWNDTTDWTSADYVRDVYTATGCPSGTRCDPVTYYYPRRRAPIAYVLTNQPDYWRGYHGFEITARKRLSAGWTLDASYSFNDARVHYGSDRAYEDPTNIEKIDNAQYAPQYAMDLTSAGIGNVFVNARWIFRTSASWRTPLGGVNLAGFYDSRSGYPLVDYVEKPRDPVSGKVPVYLDRLGDKRLPVVRTLDLRIERPFRVGGFSLEPAVDVFNLLNAGTPLSIRGKQNAPNANVVSSILPPRVIRFGLGVSW